ncbi:hypothetical protein PG985_002120 [Apiospora marii]|uniref:Uncharacterized protein n=1 Tax=Apiospora marii TaxID=335849 RepID=A0ABR1RYV5_9PEZI
MLAVTGGVKQFVVPQNGDVRDERIGDLLPESSASRQEELLILQLATEGHDPTPGMPTPLKFLLSFAALLFFTLECEIIDDISVYSLHAIGGGSISANDYENISHAGADGTLSPALDLGALRGKFHGVSKLMDTNAQEQSQGDPFPPPFTLLAGVYRKCVEASATTCSARIF